MTGDLDFTDIQEPSLDFWPPLCIYAFPSFSVFLLFSSRSPPPVSHHLLNLFFCPFLFSWDKYLYQVSDVAQEAQGRGNVLEIHFSNPLLTRRLEDCCWEFNLWLRFPSSRCSSAVTCDCISPLVIEPAVQRWFNYSAACKFCQHIWVVKDSWWQQGIVMRPDTEQQRKVYSSCWDWVMILWEKVNPTHCCSATDVKVDTFVPALIRPE